ncbi:DUF6216 family protein [Ectopseudomonas hydrolytica]|uniref:DUF6216 family protein n=1 Tax=Ectopseudomonas hydrolytica TaxID=2493633 RepID=A0ABY5ADW0_9GAMM|nr:MULTISPECIES: DUF6216 family protein [Pseudomonas]MDH0098972.1 DUF6216 family protein [Pseudomonas sp. GD04158]MPT20434.1 hypothetical protein [Pseudomonas sp.]USR41128.1 DUF6216 family protein [Pseudomonas hydrolytica]WJH58080.1 hypothetical protein FE254_18810 [Pseudomonas guguanensis]
MPSQEQGILPIISWIMDNLTALASIAYAATFIAFLLYVYTRAGSMHFLRDRIWRLMGGKSDFLIPDLQKLKLEARELEHFRFEFGIPATTIRDIEQFEHWISDNIISLKDAATAKEYIDWSDYNQLRIKEKNFTLLRKLFTYFGIFTLTSAALFFFIAIPNYLMASFEDSPFFYISTKETKFSILGGDTLDSLSCKEKEVLSRLSQENEFPLDRLQSICSTYASEEKISLLKKRISEQKSAALALALFFVLLMIYFARESTKVFAAQRIQKNLEAKQITAKN